MLENSYDVWEYTLLENQLSKMFNRKISAPKEQQVYIPELVSREGNYVKIILPEEPVFEKEPIIIPERKIYEYQAYLYKCKVCLYKVHTRVKVEKLISETAIPKNMSVRNV